MNQLNPAAPGGFQRSHGSEVLGIVAEGGQSCTSGPQPFCSLLDVCLPTARFIAGEKHPLGTMVADGLNKPTAK